MSAAAGSTGDQFLRRFVSMVLDEFTLVGHRDKVLESNQTLVDFKQPADLENELALVINGKPATDDQLLQLCRKVIAYSVKTSHPYFYNQLYAGIDEYSLSGAWLTELLNTSQATYEIAPVFTIMERQCLKFIGGKCGWRQEDIDGIFCPGGSLSNIYGIILARHRKFPECKQKGVAGLGQLVLFASEDSHYSFVKGCVWMGHGKEAVVKVKSDDGGRMDTVELRAAIRRAIEAGQVPFMVACTAGTTVLGAFDPLGPIADICAEFGLWMHVDACLGGTVLFSRKHRHLMAGIERADSMSYNAHKLAGVPLQCSLFLTRHPELLIQANSLNAEYLFQNDKYYDASYDTGDKSIQCGRKVDSLKLIMALLSRSEVGLERQVDNMMAVSAYVTEKISKRSDFKLVLDRFELSNICFWYLPKRLREDQARGIEIDKGRLHKVCPSIKGLMMREGKVMVNYQPLTQKGLPNFFRLVLTCVPEPTEADMDMFVDEIARLGEMIDV